MRRIDRLLKILTSGSFTLSGKLDTLGVLSSRRKKKKALYPIRMLVGQLFVDGEDAAVDFQVLAQVFLDEVYGELQFQDRIVIDVGAHKGYFAAYALMSGAKGVFSYEPEGKNFTCLARFAEDARLLGKAIHVTRAAVSDSDSEVTLHVSSESWRHTTLPGQQYSSGETLTVRSCSLCSILDEAKRETPERQLILKIDAEGAECPLLLNTPARCFASVKEVMFEHHSFAGCDFQLIHDRLQSLGFEYMRSEKEADLHHFRANYASVSR